MGFDGFEWESMGNGRFPWVLLGMLRGVSVPFFDAAAVDKSVVFRLGSESPFELGQLGEQSVEIVPGRCAEARCVEEVGVRDHGRLPLADLALSDQSVAADPAATGQRSRRIRPDVITGELAALGSAPVR